MFRYLPLVFKNGMRNRRRSLLTISSIAVSMCLLGVLMALYYSFFYSEATPEQALRLITRHRVSLTNVMPISYKDRIARVPGVRAVMPSQWFGGVYKEPKNMFARIATDLTYLSTVYPEYNIADDQKTALMRDRAGCLIGRTIADRFNIKVGDKITLIGDIFPGNWEFNVRAIYDSVSDNENMFFHLQYLFEGLGRGRRDFAGWFTVLVESPDITARVSTEIDTMFRNADNETKTDTERAFGLAFLSMLGNIKMILLSICCAVTFTIILVSANTMAMSVRERVKEVGVMKTLGFTNRAILGIILGEAAVISLLGGLLGYVIALGLTHAMHQLPEMVPGIKTLTVQPAVALVLFGLAVAIGVLSSFVPAWSASRTNIIESLRYTG